MPELSAAAVRCLIKKGSSQNGAALCTAVVLPVSLDADGNLIIGMGRGNRLSAISSRRADVGPSWWPIERRCPHNWTTYCQNGMSYSLTLACSNPWQGVWLVNLFSNASVFHENQSMNQLPALSPMLHGAVVSLMRRYHLVALMQLWLRVVLFLRRFWQVCLSCNVPVFTLCMMNFQSTSGDSAAMGLLTPLARSAGVASISFSYVSEAAKGSLLNDFVRSVILSAREESSNIVRMSQSARYKIVMSKASLRAYQQLHQCRRASQFERVPISWCFPHAIGLTLSTLQSYTRLENSPLALEVRLQSTRSNNALQTTLALQVTAPSTRHCNRGQFLLPTGGLRLSYADIW